MAERAVLDYVAGPGPAPGGGVRSLAPGVDWARLPVPGRLAHINVWLLADGDGVALVDTGMDLPEARAAWQGPLAAHLGGRRLTRILCTHHHPDHVGLAAWLAARHAVPVYLPAREQAMLADLLDPARGAARLAFFARLGLDADAALRPVLDAASFRQVVSGLPARCEPLVDGARLTIGALEWRVLLVGGHTDAQALLHAPAAGLLIAGDQLLPRISSNVGLYPERAEADPVAGSLASYARLGALDAATLVLPSHGEVYRGVRERAAELAAHHAATLAEALALADRPCTAAEVAGRLFRAALDPLNRMLAVGEAAAHLEHLARAGRLAAADGADGRRRYGPTARPA